MKTKDLPESQNIEDRRGDPSCLPTETLLEQAERRAAFKRALAEKNKDAKLDKELGIDDIGNVVTD